MSDPFPAVKGCCPACRSATLFLGSGGHVVCAQIECPDPDAVAQLLAHPPRPPRCRALSPGGVMCEWPAHGPERPHDWEAIHA